MLTEQDRQWLSVKYASLVVNSGVISGVLEFTATYNDALNQFLVLDDGVADTIGGRRLAGRFAVQIREREDTCTSGLPALHVDGIDPAPNRHFNQADHSACLCSPLEEQEFLTPQLDFRRFFEQLVIPFLYGQMFYSAEGRWPWTDYAHGALGLLESYGRVRDPLKAQQCLDALRRDETAWPRIRTALRSSEDVKGGTRCFCAAADQIRRCHPKAWQGIRQLKIDLLAHDVLVP